MIRFCLPQSKKLPQIARHLKLLRKYIDMEINTINIDESFENKYKWMTFENLAKISTFIINDRSFQWHVFCHLLHRSTQITG